MAEPRIARRRAIFFAAALALVGGWMMFPFNGPPNCPPLGNGESVSTIGATAVKLSIPEAAKVGPVEASAGFEGYDLSATDWVCLPNQSYDILVDGKLIARLDLSGGRPGDLELVVENLPFEIRR